MRRAPLIGSLAALTAGAGAASRTAWRAPLPDYEGTLRIPGLDNPVDVVRDRWAVPVIRAQSELDACTATGFVHASERMFAMDIMRRAAHGRLGELIDRAALRSDKLFRTFGFTKVALEELELISPEVRRGLERYSMGVNAWLEATPRIGRAWECTVVAYEPEPWTPIDSLMVGKLFSFGLSGNWEAELTRLEIREQFGSETLAAFDDDGRARSWPGSLAADVLNGAPGGRAGAGTDGHTRHRSPASDDSLDVDPGDVHDANPIVEVARELGNALREARKLFGGGDSAGSNGWAVAPERTRTGGGILAGDTHLDLTLPNSWFEQGVQCPEYSVRGFAIPGSPPVVIGHNGYVAWTITNAPCDVQDLRVERIDPSGTRCVGIDGADAPVKIRYERIAMRFTRDVEIEVRTTPNGPVISDVVSPIRTPKVLSLRWDSALTPGKTADSLFHLARARSGKDLEAAFALWRSPSQHVIWADATGAIGAQLCGDVHPRVNSDGSIPLDSDDPAGGWGHAVAFEDLPAAMNPPCGWIVNANDRLCPAHHPLATYTGRDASNGWRAQRIRELLAQHSNSDVQTHATIQLDLHSIAGRELVAALELHDIQPRTSGGKQALAALRAWDFQLEAASSGGAVYGMLIGVLRGRMTSFLGDLTAPALGKSRGPAGGTFHSLHGRLTPRIINDIERNDTTLIDAIRRHDTLMPLGWSRIISEALDVTAIKLSRACHEDDAKAWAWGAIHQVRIAHAFGFVPGAHKLVSRGPFAMGGDGDTVCQSARAPKVHNDESTIAASQRMVIDLADPDRSIAVLAGGQSAHPASPHYDDQLELWRSGRMRAMPFTVEAVDAQAVYRQQLLPTPLQRR